MTGYLCDTNIISEVMKRNPSLRVEQWLSQQPLVFVSAITLEEIQYGLTYKSALSQEQWLASFLKTRCDIIPVSNDIATQAGRWRGQFRQQGLSRSQADMLIAATAYQYGLTLVTQNIKDFQGCDILLLNPF
jgi:predicted nucleic acid-binding protein